MIAIAITGAVLLCGVRMLGIPFVPHETVYRDMDVKRIPELTRVLNTRVAAGQFSAVCTMAR